MAQLQSLANIASPLFAVEMAAAVATPSGLATPRQGVWVHFGNYEVNCAQREVLRKGIRLRLQGQPLSMLLLLIEHAGLLVTREEFRQRIWCEGTYVDFERGLTVAMHKLRLSLDDPANNPRFIETIPGRGYRFIAPVSGVYRQAQLPRIVVLPFTPLGHAPDIVPFADGLTEELTASLAHCNSHRLEVIARTSAMSYRTATKNIAEIGKDLGVTHVMEGSVRVSDEACRITAQLIDGSGQTHLWAESFDCTFTDGLRAQIEVANKIAVAILGILVA